jgi:hypothetical protein
MVRIGGCADRGGRVPGAARRLNSDVTSNAPAPSVTAIVVTDRGFLLHQISL